MEETHDAAAAEVIGEGVRTTTQEGGNPEPSLKPIKGTKLPRIYDEGEFTEYLDEAALALEAIVKSTPPTTELEIALTKILERKEALIERISGETFKLKTFVQKRKQTYKRKRKEDGAPTRALSAYNMFIKERFAQLAKENDEALRSDDANASLKRVPPANLVSKTGNEWKALSNEIKAKYEESAKTDRKRYEEEMAAYNPPDKKGGKRNKTGYNMFFSSHVIRLKQTESGVPSERGSVARLVGTAWKQLSNDEKQYYEKEADKHNGMNPVKEAEEEDEEEDVKPPHLEHPPYAYPVHPEMHMHAVPPMPAGLPHPAAPQPDPRAAHHYYPPPHVYAQHAAYGHYDYSQHHQRHPQGRQQQQQQQQPYQYPGQRHPYDM